MSLLRMVIRRCEEADGGVDKTDLRFAADITDCYRMWKRRVFISKRQK